MGYILPVNFYQYQDYQERVTRPQQDPYYIERPFKVILNSAHKQIENRHDVYGGSSSSLSMPGEAHKSRQAERIYVELTGKGRYFSETV